MKVYGPDCLVDMSDSIVRESIIFVYCIISGYFFGLIYDVFRLYRRIVKHGKFWIDLEDLLYWLICFVISFCLLYYINYGVIRLFCVLGAAFGMWLYCKTIGRIFVRAGVRIFRIIIYPLCYVKNLLTKIGKQFTMILNNLAKGGVRACQQRETKRKKSLRLDK